MYTFYNIKNIFGEKITCPIRFPVEFPIRNRQKFKIAFLVLGSLLLFLSRAEVNIFEEIKFCEICHRLTLKLPCIQNWKKLLLNKYFNCFSQL